jgi:hypothetical protein
MDGSISLLPYMEVRNLEALDKYLEDNPEIKRIMKMNSWGRTEPL